MTSDINDQDLLKGYVHEGSDESFRTLVERHIDLVYGAAFRQLNNRTLAEEVAQNVFVTLTTRASWLTGHPSLAGWLYHTAVNQARQQFRSEQRRHARETTAMAIQPGGDMQPEESLLKSLTPVLDEEMLELRELEREALILRYVEDKSLREVGAMLGISEDTAQKRVARALETLTARFRRRGYKVTAVTTTAAALRLASDAAPAGLSALATKAALSASSAATATGVGLLIAKIMGLTKTQVAVVCALVAAGPVAYEWHASARAANEQKQLRNEIQQLSRQLDDGENRLGASQKKLQATGSNLNRLGGEIDRQKELAAIARASAATNFYLWDDSSDYVRLPKNIVDHLKLSSSFQYSRSEGRYGTAQTPVLDEDGSLTEQATHTLGITPEEETRIKQAYQNFLAGYQQETLAHTLITNVPPKEFNVQGDSLSRIKFAFPTKGQALKERLQTSMTTILGQERGKAVWEQVESTLNNRFNNFGEADFIETMARQANGRLRYWKGHRGLQPGSPWLTSMVTELQDKHIPEEFRPIVARLKPAAKK